jgi:hypothetical protein
MIESIFMPLVVSTCVYACTLHPFPKYAIFASWLCRFWYPNVPVWKHVE